MLLAHYSMIMVKPAIVYVNGRSEILSYSQPDMGEINRGGLPDLDRKSRSGFFFRPDLDQKSRSGFFFVPILILHRDRGA